VTDLKILGGKGNVVFLNLRLGQGLRRSQAVGEFFMAAGHLTPI